MSHVGCWAIVVCLAVTLTGCNVQSYPEDRPLAVPSLMPTLPPAPTVASSSGDAPLAQAADSSWIAAGSGVEIRRLRVEVEGSIADISIARLDPALVRFQAGYAPGQPQPLARWHAESGALAAINGGFFDEQLASTALVIHDGIINGESYVDRGGMFAVNSAGQITLRALAKQPYDPNEPLIEAIQGWPMLIAPGGSFASSLNDQEIARRSVVALDRSGRVLFIVTSSSTFTLRSLANWLVSSDLDLDAALNLDGGSSSGLIVESGDQRETVFPFVPLPLVLLALPR